MKNQGIILVVLAALSLLSVCFASTTQDPMLQTNTWQILKVNLHAHTTYSDGTYTPTQLVDIYKDAGYDVLAITDHNTVAGYAEAFSEGEKVGLTVIRGEEVTCSWSDGPWKHVVALFTNQSIGITLGSHAEIPTIFDAIHAQNGIGIVAHAWHSWNNWQNYTNVTYIDGWEVDYSMAWTLESNYIYVCSHDFHNETFLEGLSIYWTYLLAESRTEADVKEALIEKRIVVYGDGKLFGSHYALSLYDQNQDPTANAGSDQTVNEDTSATFDGSASSDNVGVTSYTWTFTDATTKTLTGMNPSYTFNTPGVYTITLNVKDATGNEATDTITITVLDVTKPVANAGQDQSANAGASVSFDAGASSDNMGVASYNWNFGDGTTGTGRTATHAYASAGTYTVTLTVKDAAGNSATDTMTVAVSPAEGGEGFPQWIIGVIIAAITILVAVMLLWRRRKAPQQPQTSSVS